MALFSPPRDFLLNIGLGLIPNFRRISALGKNPVIDSATVPEDIWTNGGIYPFITAAQALELVSTSANDTAAGTGARSVSVNTLDATYAEVTQTIVPNGLTAVALPTSSIAVNPSFVTVAGSLGNNDGDLIIRDAGGGTVRAVIPAGIGITQQSQFTVPAGHALLVTAFIYSINRPSTIRDATITTFSRRANGSFILPLELSIDGNPHERATPLGVPVAEKGTFGLRCLFVSANGTNITAGWEGILRKL